VTPDQLRDTIIRSCHTKEDVLRRLAFLRNYLEYRYYKQGDMPIGEYLKDKNTKVNDSAVMSSWGDDFYQSFNKDNFYMLITQFTEGLKDNPLVTVYMPVNLDTEVLDKIGSWFQDNLDKGVLMDIRINPKIVGGCEFVWKGVSHHYTLEYFFAKKSDEIKNIISDYANTNKSNQT